MSFCNYTGYCCAYNSPKSCNQSTGCIVPVIPSAPTTNYANAINTLTQKISSGTALSFDKNISIGGLAIMHTAGNTNFTIVKEGIYEIEFITMASAEIERLNSVGIALNGNLLEGTSMSQTSANVGEVVNLKTQAIITLATEAVNEISIVNTSNGNICYSSPNISIVKIA